MSALAIDLHPVRAGANGVCHSSRRIKLLAQLVEVRHLQIGAEAHAAGIRRQSAKNQFQQCGFAHTVRANQGQLVAAHDAQRQLVDQCAAGKTLADIGQLGDQFARAFPGVDGNAHIAKPFAPRAALLAQRFKSSYATFIARAPRFDTFANPDLFLRPEFVETAMRNVLGCELLSLSQFVGGVIAREGAQHATVKFDNTRRHTIQKRAVMRNDQRRIGAQNTLF